MSGNGLSTRIGQFLDLHERLMAGTQSPFHRLGQQMQDLLGDGGDPEGSGPTWRRLTSAKRIICVNGFLEYSDQPFEITSHLKYPRMMKLGRDVTLCGLELGILTMRNGEFSHFLFLPAYAYGEMGCLPLIPPVATVLYEVQVLDFLDSAQVDEFFAMSLEEQNTVPLSTLFNVVDTELSFGNRCFNQSRFEDAKDRYKQAYLELFDYEKAQDYLTMAQANKPFDIDINNLLRKLAVCYKDYLDKEKELCFKMCADFVKK